MDGMSTVIGSIIAALGLVAVGVLTRRSAKDTTAVDGFDRLTKAQREQMDRDAAEIAESKAYDRVRRGLVRKHELWDRDRIREAHTAGREIPDPPPLDLDT